MTKSNNTPRSPQQLLQLVAPIAARLCGVFERQRGESHAAALVDGGGIPDLAEAYALAMLEDGATDADVIEQLGCLRELDHTLVVLPLSLGQSGPFAHLFKAGSLALTWGDEVLAFELVPWPSAEEVARG